MPSRLLSRIEAPTLIAEGTYLQGELHFTSDVHIFGTVEGTVHNRHEHAVHLAKTGWVKGHLVTDGLIVVEGRVEGDISSTSAIRLMSTAIVTGQVKAPKVSVRPGASLSGTIASGQPTASKRSANQD